ncbi:MAG: hypothetical protein PWQ09_553 [Candidatus Cloacimonadota bacterium]|nr:hypothetical protein [Candidatus Cloacimonadota bacterium]
MKIEGDLDLEILMGKSKYYRAGFQGIKVITTIEADMSKEEKEKFVNEIDERCPIADNIAGITPIEFVVK